MANNKKDVSFSVDLDELDRQLVAQREQEQQDEKEISVRSTVFSLGNDPRLGTKQQTPAPDFYLIDILKDRMDNPYLKLHWRAPRSEIDSGKIIGFNVYRRDISNAVSFGGTKPLEYNISAFDKLSRGNKRTGRFSRSRKAMYNIRRGSIPAQILNPNLYQLGLYEQSHLFSETKEDSSSSAQAEFERFFSDKKFNKIAYVDYTKFLAEEKNKFLYIKDRNFIDLSYKDKAVGFFETFEYYIEAVTGDLDAAPRSDVIVVTVEDLNIVNPPASLTAKQVTESEIHISARLDSADNVSKVFFYRRASDEVFFELLAVGDNISNCLKLIDASVQYQKSYVYRVFCQNVHGILSEPREIVVFSSVQRITPQSRSNSLRIPIVSAVQDQNSDFVKITIFPNDSNISFYELKRRDFTIFEKDYKIPSSAETNYGGTGWSANKFFVERIREPVAQMSDGTTTALKTKTSAKEIVFVDNTVSPNHIYQYRVRGYDLFGNPSSYAFSTVTASGKKSIRTPINVRAEILRGYPFRLKLMWDDDNLLTNFSASQLFEGQSSIDKQSNKNLYKVQRRKFSEVSYESFPLTANKFVIDEVASNDVVLFDGNKIEDSFIRSSNISSNDENIIVKDGIERAFGLPTFLKENDVYLYRISVINDIGEESNATEEFRISTLADLSDPLNFIASVVNSKVRPVSVRLSWDVNPFESKPDYWVIEKKYDSPNDSFSVLGKAYLATEFFDRNVEIGNTYIYRIKAFDSTGRESRYFQARLTL